MDNVIDLGGKLPKDTARAAAQKLSAWMPLRPVPADAPAPPETGPKGDRPSLTWSYRDAGGALLGYVLRFDRADGSKDFRPLVFAVSRERPSERDWRFQSWEAPGRPLYGLDRLAAAPLAPVLVVEGEKAADAAGRLAPGHVVVTSPGGAKGAGAADWSPLRRRHVVIWPDADEAGTGYAEHVAKILKALGVTADIVAPPAEVAKGWDAADAEAAGWTAAQVAGLIAGAGRSEKGAPGAAENGERGRKERASGVLIEQLGAVVELWHDPNRNPYGTITAAGGHRENMALDSRVFEIWLSGFGLDAVGEVPGETALRDTIRTLKARAIHHGPEHEVWRRTALVGERVYIDLGDPQWRAIEIDRDGWRLVDRAPVKFLRSQASRPLPMPERSDQAIRDLWGPFLNVATEGDLVLVVSFAVAALHPQGPYPIICLNGEHGSGKSFASKMLRLLIDPNAAPIRVLPATDRDLFITADNAWMQAFDNLSSIPGPVADSLCRVSTGGGFATRAMTTDRDEAIFNVCRPIVLNGIPDLTRQPDLASRAIPIGLSVIAEDKRRPESVVWAEFERAAPVILGALLDGLSAALRNRNTVALARLPRMADFATLAVAAADGLGWHGDDFIAAYDNNLAGTVAAGLEASILAEVMQRFAGELEPGKAWRGTMTELLALLNERATEAARKARTWPRTAAELGNACRRLAPSLRSIGLDISHDRAGKDRQRITSITKIDPRAAAAGLTFPRAPFPNAYAALAMGPRERRPVDVYGAFPSR